MRFWPGTIPETAPGLTGLEPGGQRCPPLPTCSQALTPWPPVGEPDCPPSDQGSKTGRLEARITSEVCVWKPGPCLPNRHMRRSQARSALRSGDRGPAPYGRGSDAFMPVLKWPQRSLRSLTGYTSPTREITLIFPPKVPGGLIALQHQGLSLNSRIS